MKSVLHEEVLGFDPNSAFPNDMAGLLHRLVYMGNATSRWEYGEFKQIEVGNHVAAQVTTNLANYAQGEFLLIDLGNDYMAKIMLLTPPNELARWQETIVTIAESISYDPTQISPLVTDPNNYHSLIREHKTYKNDNAKGEFEYPSNWLRVGHKAT